MPSFDSHCEAAPTRSCGTGPGGRLDVSSATAACPVTRAAARLAFRTHLTSRGMLPLGETRVEPSLAEAVPLWRTLRDEGVTALITPALDYVGGLELGTKDVRFESGEVIAQLGESLRNLISSLDDRCSLLFVYRVTDDVEDVIREYESGCASGESSALRVYVAARAEWLRKQRLRRIRVFLFFSLTGVSISALGRGALGGKLVFGNADAIAQERHQAELKSLAQLRERIVGRVAQMGPTAREPCARDVWRIHYQPCNPTRARQRLAAPEVAVRDRKSVV